VSLRSRISRFRLLRAVAMRARWRQACRSSGRRCGNSASTRAHVA
jgi:hypothetical protein